MNKYKAESKIAQSRRKETKSCRKKRQYKTKDEAKCKGSVVYKCRYCQQFHRASISGYRKRP